MEIGDLVRVRRFLPGTGSVGVLISKKILLREYRFDVLLEGEKIVSGIPERYLEVISV